jgi:pyruvate dehydrogenase complex dehydrogenase (E1) component
MVYLKLKDNSKQAKLMLEYLKLLPFVEVIEEQKIKNKINIPNQETIDAIMEAETDDLKTFDTVEDLMADLNS